MERRVWTGVVAGVLAAALLLTVGFGAFRAGQDDEQLTRVVETSEGEVVRVVGDGHHWGPGPGFFLFPLLIVLLVVLVAKGRAHRWHGPGGYGPGWHRGYGPGPGGRGGPGGPGGWGCGPGREVPAGRWEWVPAEGGDPAAGRGDPGDAVDPSAPVPPAPAADPGDPGDPADRPPTRAGGPAAPRDGLPPRRGDGTGPGGPVPSPRDCRGAPQDPGGRRRTQDRRRGARLPDRRRLRRERRHRRPGGA